MITRKNGTRVLFAVFFVVATWVTQSCKKQNKESVTPVQLDLQISVDDDSGAPIPLNGTAIRLTSKVTGQVSQATSDAQGKAVFESIIPGVYELTASLTIAAEDYSALSGVFVENDVTYSLNNESLEVFSDLSLPLRLEATGIIGNLVFKQIYYAGSNTQQGAAFRDVFVEIYNNSSGDLYMDSLYFAEIIGKNNNNAFDYTLPNFQYDWSKAAGITGTDPNNDYVYAKYLFMFPSDGTGKKYLIKPGESRIMAATAINHSEPYQKNDGTVQGVNNPELTIDLSKADFDVWMVPYNREIKPDGKDYAFDINNPSVDKMEILFANPSNDWVTDALGRAAYVIFKVDGTQNVKEYPAFATPNIAEPTANTVRYPQIPVKYVVDAVEIRHPIATSMVPKRLPNKLDASRTFVPGGQYSGQSLVRKTKTIVNGRRILQDTNNSENDFGYLEKADPSKGPSSFID